MKKSDYRFLHQEAHAAGMAAGNAAQPIPMIVGSPKHFLGDDLDPDKPQYFVADGVCGFAWVKFPGNKPFGQWAKKAGIARPGYPSGLQMSVREFGQSMQRKEDYAHAYAGVLRNAGIDAWPESRMD
jgi:hypothetical protein